MNNTARIIGSNYRNSRQSLLWSGSTYHIDHDTDFVTRKGLPKIATVTSIGGRVFDIYRGIGKSILGGELEFGCAVEVTE